MDKRTQNILVLINQINSFLITNNLLSAKTNLLIALSGGQDSISILLIFYIFKNQWNFQIVALYCNHLWQKESLSLFIHLSKISFHFSIPFSYTVTLKSQNSEKLARTWRLKNFSRLVTFLKFSFIITGHTQTDQIETFLFNLVRGTGLRGGYALTEKKELVISKQQQVFIANFDLQILTQLKQKHCIPLKNNNKKKLFYKKNIKIHLKKLENKSALKKKKYTFSLQKNEKVYFLRPLVDQSRFDIQRITLIFKLPIFPDKSNQKIFYRRNRIRKQIIPALRFFFNPQLDQSLSKYNQILKKDQIIFENLILYLFSKIIFENTNFFILNRSFFLKIPSGLQERICLNFFENKLKISVNFDLIRIFLEVVRKRNFIENNWCFFPKIGLLYCSKNILIISK